jgi:glycine betaine/proline transport system substrate-binding protein
MVLLTDRPYDEAVFTAGECEIPNQALMIVSSKEFAKRAPDLAVFFAKYQTGSVIVSSALAYIDETGKSHDEAAQWMLKENPQLLDAWLTVAQVKKVKKALGE